MLSDEERVQIRVRDRPAACLVEIRQWLDERRTCRFTVDEQIDAMHRMSGWGSATLLAALIDVLEGDAT